MGGGQIKDGEPNKTQTSQWTPEITGKIDRDKYDRTVMGPYDRKSLHRAWSADACESTEFRGPPIMDREGPVSAMWVLVGSALVLFSLSVFVFVFVFVCGWVAM